MSKEISREELKEKISDRSVTLLEALPLEHYRRGHLPTARPFSRDTTNAAEIEALLPDKAAEIVVYCSSVSCGNSHAAQSQLSQLGYRHVRVYAGGKADWVTAGERLEEGA